MIKNKSMQDKKSDYTLEKSSDGLLWKIHASDGSVIGSVGLAVEESDYLEAPSLQLSFDKPTFVGHDIASAVIKDTIKYAYCNLPYEELFARYEVTNGADEKLYKSLGFEVDGKMYKDNDGREWQNAKLVL